MITNIKKIIFGLLASLAITSIVPLATANAAGCTTGNIFPSWYDGLCTGNGDIKSPAQMGGADTGAQLGAWIGTIALNIVDILLFIVGYASLGFIIFGGFKYMTQGDNQSGVAAAKKTITNAVIGLILSIMSIAIVKFVTGAISG